MLLQKKCKSSPVIFFTLMDDKKKKKTKQIKVNTGMLSQVPKQTLTQRQLL